MIAGRSAEAVAKNQTTLEVKSDRELVITRLFNGPPRIVFDAWTKPELVRRWWAPKSHGVTVIGCDADIRVGGKYRYVLRHQSGDLTFSGEYTEVTPYSRLAYTNIFEPMAHAGAALVTVDFEEVGDKTRLISHELYPSKEALDMTIASGMEHGMRETMDQLDELVASLG